MGFRFHKSVRLLPGLRLNISKNGLNSLSVGGRGMTLNIGKKGTRQTIGMPGTGLSHTSYTPYEGDRKDAPVNDAEHTKSINLWPVLFGIAAIVYAIYTHR